MLAVAALPGCTNALLGDPPSNQIEASCPVGLDQGHAAVGVLWAPNGATCAATLIGTQTALTTAGCVMEDATTPRDPVIVVFSGRQYIAEGINIQSHPGWDATVGIDDLAILKLSEPANGVAPIVLASSVPVLGEKLLLLGFETWAPNSQTNPERQAARDLRQLHR